LKGKSGVWSFYRQRVKVKIEGFNAGRLINLAHGAGILMRNVRIISDTEAEGWIGAADLNGLRGLAKSRYRITVTDRQGAEHRARRVLAKPVTIAGVFLASSIVIVQSMFIASVQIQGYRAIPEDSLRLCLEQAGVCAGSFRPAIDWEGARDSLRETFPQLTWIQLVYDGRKAVLNVHETGSRILSAEAEPGSDIFVPSGEQEKKYASIVAERSGYIEKISTLWGAAMAEPGDYVQEGDVLISGVVPMEPTTFQEDWPTEYYVRAKGEVTALVPYRLTFNQERYVCDEADEGQSVLADRREKTREEAEAVLNQQVRLWKKENLPENAEIVNESLNFSFKNNIITIGMTLEVRQQIGIEKEIVVGQENSDN